MPLPKKEYFSIHEVAERWHIPIQDVLYYGAVGELQLSTLACNWSVEPLAKPSHDGTTQTSSQKSPRMTSEVVTGPVSLLEQDALLIFRDGEAFITACGDSDRQWKIILIPNKQANSIPNKQANLIPNKQANLIPNKQANSTANKKGPVQFKVTVDKVYITRRNRDQFEEKYDLLVENQEKLSEAKTAENKISKKEKTLMKMIAVLVRLFIERDQETKELEREIDYGTTDEPNVKQVLELMQRHVQDNRLETHGLGSSSLHAYISEGLRLLHPKTNNRPA